MYGLATNIKETAIEIANAMKEDRLNMILFKSN